MPLSEYSIEDLQTLQLAVGIAKASAIKFDVAFQFNKLDAWGTRIDDAIRAKSVLNLGQPIKNQPICG
jgi:hypothetical protein